VSYINKIIYYLNIDNKYAYYDLNDSNYIILYYLINTVLFIKNRRLVDSKPRGFKNKYLC